jgi:hypothetical protein
MLQGICYKVQLPEKREVIYIIRNQYKVPLNPPSSNSVPWGCNPPLFIIPYSWITLLVCCSGWSPCGCALYRTSRAVPLRPTKLSLPVYNTFRIIHLKLVNKYHIRTVSVYICSLLDRLYLDSQESVNHRIIEIYYKFISYKQNYLLSMLQCLQKI